MATLDVRILDPACSLRTARQTIKALQFGRDVRDAPLTNDELAAEKKREGRGSSGEWRVSQ
jgi:hypothetical protein